MLRSKLIASEHIVVADSSWLTQYESHSDSLVQHLKSFSFQVFSSCVHAATGWIKLPAE